MRLLALIILCCRLAGAMAQPLDRAQVESRLDWAIENRLAEAEQESLRQRARALAAESGPRLFGSAGLSEVRDVVTRDVVRSYPGVSAQIGVRWPLFGSRESENRARLSARAALDEGAWKGAGVRAEALRSLRLAYVEAIRRDEQVSLADAFLSHQAEATRILSRRREQRLLLEGDYRELLSMFDLASRDRAALAEERDRARRRLTLITGLAVDNGILPPAFRTGCLTLERVLAARPAHAALQLARARRVERQRLLSRAGNPVPEAGVVLSQSVVQEIGGQTGGSTYLGIDFRLPMDWRGAADARRAEALAELERAELAERQAGMQFEEAARQVVDGLRLRVAGLAFADERLSAARAQLQTARVRLGLADGDVIEKLFQARQAVYRAASDQVEARLAFERAQLEALVLTPECSPEEDKPVALAGSQTIAQELSQGLGAGPPGPGRQAGRFGWYAWSGAKWLERAEDPAWLTAISRHTGRLMLSFNASEIAALARREPLAERLQRFLTRAHARGMAVDLLLGDPSWLDPAGRGQLLEYLRALSGFPFDHLHLDLERSQLPAGDRPAYPRWLVDTLRDASHASPWPVDLSLHYREADSPALVKELQAAGLRELCLMVYVSNPQRVRQIMEPVLSRHPNLAVAVAQSVEPQLPAGESLAGRGAARALAALADLDRSLQSFANFSGVRVQSLEHFLRLPP